MNSTIEAMISPAAVRATYCDLASGRTSAVAQRQQRRQRQHHQEHGRPAIGLGRVEVARPDQRPRPRRPARPPAPGRTAGSARNWSRSSIVSSRCSAEYGLHERADGDHHADDEADDGRQDSSTVGSHGRAGARQTFHSTIADRAAARDRAWPRRCGWRAARSAPGPGHRATVSRSAVARRTAIRMATA